MQPESPGELHAPGREVGREVHGRARALERRAASNDQRTRGAVEVPDPTLEGNAASVTDPLLQGDGWREPGALDLPTELPNGRSKTVRRRRSEFEASGLWALASKAVGRRRNELGASGLRSPAGKAFERRRSEFRASGLWGPAGKAFGRRRSEPRASGVRAPTRPGAGDLALARARRGGLLGAGHGSGNELGGWLRRLSRLQDANLRGIRRSGLQRPRRRRHDADPDPQQHDRPAPVSGHTDPLQEHSGSPCVSASGRGR